MTPVPIPCSQNAHDQNVLVRRPQWDQHGCHSCREVRASFKGWKGTARPSFLLAEAARSECAPSMRAVKDSLAAPLRAKWGESIRMASLDARIQG